MKTAIVYLQTQLYKQFDDSYKTTDLTDTLRNTINDKIVHVLTSSCAIVSDLGFSGNALSNIPTANACFSACLNNNSCVAATYNSNAKMCYLAEPGDPLTFIGSGSGSSIICGSPNTLLIQSSNVNNTSFQNFSTSACSNTIPYCLTVDQTTLLPNNKMSYNDLFKNTGNITYGNFSYSVPSSNIVDGNKDHLSSVFVTMRSWLTEKICNTILAADSSKSYVLKQSDTTYIMNKVSGYLGSSYNVASGPLTDILLDVPTQLVALQNAEVSDVDPKYIPASRFVEKVGAMDSQAFVANFVYYSNELTSCGTGIFKMNELFVDNLQNTLSSLTSRMRTVSIALLSTCAATVVAAWLIHIWFDPKVGLLGKTSKFERDYEKLAGSQSGGTNLAAAAAAVAFAASAPEPAKVQTVPTSTSSPAPEPELSILEKIKQKKEILQQLVNEATKKFENATKAQNEVSEQLKRAKKDLELAQISSTDDKQAEKLVEELKAELKKANKEFNVAKDEATSAAKNALEFEQKVAVAQQEVPLKKKHKKLADWATTILKTSIGIAFPLMLVALISGQISKSEAIDKYNKQVLKQNGVTLKDNCRSIMHTLYSDMITNDYYGIKSQGSQGSIPTILSNSLDPWAQGSDGNVDPSDDLLFQTIVQQTALSRDVNVKLDPNHNIESLYYNYINVIESYGKCNSLFSTTSTYPFPIVEVTVYGTLLIITFCVLGYLYAQLQPFENTIQLRLANKEIVKCEKGMVISPVDVQEALKGVSNITEDTAEKEEIFNYVMMILGSVFFLTFAIIFAALASQIGNKLEGVMYGSKFFQDSQCYPPST
jgi:hypothetical protein